MAHGVFHREFGMLYLPRQDFKDLALAPRVNMKKAHTRFPF